MTPLEVIAETLDGMTPDEIAELLLREGCRGVRGNACFCPVAQYLYWKLGRVWLVNTAQMTQPGSVTIQGPTPANWASTPSSVAEFIRRFDRKRYPQLVI